MAELTGLLDLDGWPAGMRVIVRCERPHPGAQLRFTANARTATSRADANSVPNVWAQSMRPRTASMPACGCKRPAAQPYSATPWPSGHAPRRTRPWEVRRTFLGR